MPLKRLITSKRGSIINMSLATQIVALIIQPRKLGWVVAGEIEQENIKIKILFEL